MHTMLWRSNVVYYKDHAEQTATAVFVVLLLSTYVYSSYVLHW